MRDTTGGFFQRYGLAFVMVASVVGAGSLFIASSAGIQYGYALIWAFIGAALIGIMAQDMSARLGIFGEPLGTFMRRKFGERLAVAIGFVLSIGAFLWVIGLTVATAKGFAVLTGGAIGWMPLSIVITALAIVTGVLNYEGLERIMTAMLFVLLAAYLDRIGVHRLMHRIRPGEANAGRKRQQDRSVTGDHAVELPLGDPPNRGATRPIVPDRPPEIRCRSEPAVDAA